MTWPGPAKYYATTSSLCASLLHAHLLVAGTDSSFLLKNPYYMLKKNTPQSLRLFNLWPQRHPSHMAAGPTHHRCSAGMANICVPLSCTTPGTLIKKKKSTGFLQLWDCGELIGHSQRVGEMRGRVEETKGHKMKEERGEKGCRWRNTRHIVWTWAHRRITRSRCNNTSRVC